MKEDRNLWKYNKIGNDDKRMILQGKKFFKLNYSIIEIDVPRISHGFPTRVRGDTVNSVQGPGWI